MFWFFFLVTFFSLNAISKNECDYYKTQNNILTCSSETNYLLKYGHKYCLAFTDLMTNTKSENLKKWVINTRSCLQEMIQDNSKRYAKNDCNKLKEFAFDVHPICYKESNICELSLLEKNSVLKVIMKNDFITDFGSNKRATVLQILNVGSACISKIQILSSGGQIFYDLFLKNKIALGIEGVALAVEIIDLAPTEEKKVAEYFYEILSNLFGANNTKTKNEINDFIKLTQLSNEFNQTLDPADFTKRHVLITKYQKIDLPSLTRANIAAKKYTYRHSEKSFK